MVVIPGKLGLELWILVPAAPLSIPTVATPTLYKTDGMQLALKVLIPTKPSSVPYTDFTSDIECCVTPNAILPLLIPLMISCSFLIKVPVVS